MPVEARFLFIGIWTEADDEGKLIDSSKLLAGSLFPHDAHINARHVERWLQALADVGAIIRYEVNGARYIQVREWSHQKISHPGVSRIPNPSDNPPETLGNITGDTPESLRPDLGSRIIGSSTRDARDARLDTFESDFNECWDRYPKRLARKAALKCYQARRRDGVSQTDLLLATTNYEQSRKTQDPKFTMLGSTFYGPNERWKDFLEVLPETVSEYAKPHPLDNQAAAARRLQVQTPQDRVRDALHAARLTGDDIAIEALEAELAALV